MNAKVLSETQSLSFQRDGFLVVPGLLEDHIIEQMRVVADDHVAAQLAPVEYEVDVQYPGSPLNAKAEGGETTRRLLHAYSRHEVYRNWASDSSIKAILQDLFAARNIELSQCHHNCIMTKHPGFSSATLWHQDNRYWSFDEQNLISVWTALGDENRENGCLRVIPGSHHLVLDPGCFDAAMFLRPDLPTNKLLIQNAIRVELKRGDVLFFHSKLFHAAGRNLTGEVKYSLVYTYHESSNRPIRDTRSARSPGIPI
ncbi:MAG: phytanoyl-CoA hydroxylase [Candidatus Azotimanducaceae bacterium]|jgi:phytanoyl-CoA hydroxylase